MKALTIAGTNLRRFVRARFNLFFVIILPMLLILLLGATFGGAFTPVIGVAGQELGPLGEEMVASLEGVDNLDLKRYAGEDSLLRAVERGQVQAGLVIPADYGTTIRAGDDVVLRFFGRPGSLAQQLRAAVEAAVSEQSVIVRAARFAGSERVASPDVALQMAAQAAAVVPGVQVRTASAGETLSPESMGTFDVGASTQLLLFIFLTSLTGSVALIETRRLGLSRRMLSTPTPMRTILAGEVLGRLAIALLQGLIIMLGSAVIFGVDWGNPAGAALVLLMFSLVGAGAGALIGSVVSNDQQAGSVAILVGLGMAALGGSMVPIEVFPETMRAIAHVTPHAWGNDAFANLVRRGGGVTDILAELGALAAYAVALLALATWRLRRAITA